MKRKTMGSQFYKKIKRIKFLLQRILLPSNDLHSATCFGPTPPAPTWIPTPCVRAVGRTWTTAEEGQELEDYAGCPSWAQTGDLRPQDQGMGEVARVLTHFSILMEYTIPLVISKE